MAAPVINWSQVASLPGAAGLADVAPYIQELSIGLAIERFDPAVCGKEGSRTLTMLRLLFCAHLATMLSVGVGGAVTQESAGALARSYAAPDTTKPYQETSYGRQLWQMLRATGARIGFAVTWDC